MSLVTMSNSLSRALEKSSSFWLGKQHPLGFYLWTNRELVYFLAGCRKPKCGQIKCEIIFFPHSCPLRSSYRFFCPEDATVSRQAWSRGLLVMVAVFPDLKSEYNASPCTYSVGKSWKVWLEGSHQCHCLLRTLPVLFLASLGNISEEHTEPHFAVPVRETREKLLWCGLL